MGKKLTVSTFELFNLIPDAESARKYIEKKRWKDGVICPQCQATASRITVRVAGFYRCNDCDLTFTVRTGTIFERSHIPLNKWLYAMYLLVTARKGISSLQLSKEIGVTQKTAWFMLGRLREACGGEDFTLNGTIELDETYFGGLEKNKHRSKLLNSGRGSVGKTAVFGMRERGGRLKASTIEKNNKETIQGIIQNSVAKDSTIMTDDHRAYMGLGQKGFKHETVNHTNGVYVRGNVSTNGIESVWAVMKRGVNGVYHHVSPKHLNRYVQEFSFRLNEGNVARTSLDRMGSLLHASIGKRLTWEGLTK
jgi:transposase-like protein